MGGGRRLLAIGRLAASLVVGVLLALLVYRIVHGSPGTSLARALAAQRAPVAPDVRLSVLWRPAVAAPATLAGPSFRLAGLRGRPVVLNFWASWCTPCRHEAGLLAAAARAHAGHVVFVGVDVHDAAGDARRFLAAHRVPYLAVRGGASILDRFGLIGLPETFYLDRRGRIVGVTRGELSAGVLARQLARATHTGPSAGAY